MLDYLINHKINHEEVSEGERAIETVKIFSQIIDLLLSDPYCSVHYAGRYIDVAAQLLLFPICDEVGDRATLSKP